jgi:hypothetical protein
MASRHGGTRLDGCCVLTARDAAGYAARLDTAPDEQRGGANSYALNDTSHPQKDTA